MNAEAILRFVLLVLIIVLVVTVIWLLWGGTIHVGTN